MKFPLAVVILARDEADVIERSLVSLRSQLQPGDSLHVVADHCRDATAEVAAGYRAQIHRREEGSPGKGRALSWWLKRLDQLELDPAGIVVVDADSLASPGFIAELRTALMSDHQVAQSRVAPMLQSADPISILAALSEDIEQRVFDRLRRLLGAPVRLRGTGMAFHADVLRQVAWSLETSVEDAELSLLLFERGSVTKPVAQAVIHDPKPVDGNAASRQRARWLQGQWQLIAKRPRLLLRVAARGPAGWSLLGALFMKPRALLLPFLFVLAVFGLILGASSQVFWLSSFLLLPFAANVAGLLLGLLLAPTELRRSAWQALPRAHQFILMWFRSWRLARRSQDPWLRARHRIVKRRMGEATSAGR